MLGEIARHHWFVSFPCIASGRTTMASRTFVALGFLVVCSLNVRSAAQEPKPAERKDAYSDPLPAGALARLGTARLCHPYAEFLMFAPDGKRLVTVSSDLVRVWDVAGGSQIREWQVPRTLGYSPAWSPLAFSPDGKLLALACGDKSLRVFEATTGKEILKQARGFINAVAFAPDGSALATVEEDRVRVIHPRTGALRHELEACKHLQHVAFSSDSKTIVAVGHDKPDRKVFCIYAFDAATGKQTDDHFFEFPSSFASRLSPDGKHLVVPDWK